MLAFTVALNGDYAAVGAILSRGTATDLRKRVKGMSSARFGLRPINQGGGAWVHRAEPPSGFEVEIAYGGTLGQQLRYWVHLDFPELNRQVQRRNFEQGKLSDVQ